MRRAVSIIFVALLLLGARTQTRAAIPINACGTIIKTSGSYVVAKNLSVKNGSSLRACIEVATSFVAIDLAGFTIDCSGVPIIGIDGGGQTGIIVRNGIVAGCFYGLTMGTSLGVLVDGLTVTNGSSVGIIQGQGGDVLRSVVNDNTVTGIFTAGPSSIQDSTAIDGSHGIVQAVGVCTLFNDLAAP